MIGFRCPPASTDLVVRQAARRCSWNCDRGDARRHAAAVAPGRELGVVERPLHAAPAQSQRVLLPPPRRSGVAGAARRRRRSGRRRGRCAASRAGAAHRRAAPVLAERHLRADGLAGACNPHPLAKVERFTPWEPDAGERASLEECGVAVADDLGASPASPAPNRSARARPTSDSGSHSSPKSRAGWFSGFTNQLLGTARSSPKSIVAPPSKTGTRPCWELCQIEAERLVTMLEDNKCTPFQTVAPLQPLLFAIKQTAAGSREDEHADPRALECSVLITLLMSDAAVKREASAAPWSPVSPLLHQLIRDHEVACLELPVPEQATSGHQRLLCRGRAVRVSPLVEIPGLFPFLARARTHSLSLSALSCSLGLSLARSLTRALSLRTRALRLGSFAQGRLHACVCVRARVCVNAFTRACMRACTRACVTVIVFVGVPQVASSSPTSTFGFVRSAWAKRGRSRWR